MLLGQRPQAAPGSSRSEIVSFATQHTAAADEADLIPHKCECGGKSFEISVGLHVYRDASNQLSDHVRWIYVGVRCPDCERLQIAGDWKNDYHPLAELLALI